MTRPATLDKVMTKSSLDELSGRVDHIGKQVEDLSLRLSKDISSIFAILSEESSGMATNTIFFTFVCTLNYTQLVEVACIYFFRSMETSDSSEVVSRVSIILLSGNNATRLVPCFSCIACSLTHRSRKI